MISWMKTERSWLLAITVVPLCQVEKLLHLLNGEFVAARFLGASQDALCQVKFVLLKIRQSQVVRMKSYGDFEQRVAIDLISYEIWSFISIIHLLTIPAVWGSWLQQWPRTGIDGLWLLELGQHGRYDRKPEIEARLYLKFPATFQNCIVYFIPFPIKTLATSSHTRKTTIF